MEKKEMVNQQLEQAKKSRLSTINISLNAQYLELRLMFIFPLLFLLTLVLITPVPIDRKIVIMFWSFLLFFSFILLKTLIIILYTISTANIGIYQLKGFSLEMVAIPHQVLSIVPTSYIIVSIIWVFATFRKNNWQQILESFGTKSVK
ncbi:MAG: hypothetical protein IPJ74_17350 [Saprospiraceae bacterium]|nr:hypothetical protein [Saprospiraceae bacterium]